MRCESSVLLRWKQVSVGVPTVMAVLEIEIVLFCVSQRAYRFRSNMTQCY